MFKIKIEHGVLAQSQNRKGSVRRFYKIKKQEGYYAEFVAGRRNRHPDQGG